jgi:type IV pilus assembly protein PilE
MQNQQQSGFTLIELMIVVAIISILAAVSTAYFGDNITSARRTDGRTALLNAAATLEKCKAVYGAYNNANCSITSSSSIASSDGYYTITAPTLSATAFTLQALPVTGKSQADDTECTKLTLTHLGIQSGTPATNECW